MINPILGSRLLLIAVVLWLAMAAPARADFIITGEPGSVSAGGTTTISFYITSDKVAGDQLGSFQIQLIANQTASLTGDGLNLSFTMDQPMVYDQSNFVFAGSSGFQDNDIPFWGTPFSTVTANDTIVGGDFNDSGPGYTTIKAGTTYLLAQVQVDPAQAGDVFSISLTPPSQDPNNPTTYFDDQDGNGIGFSSTPATVTTTAGATATPAPSSLVLAGIGSLSGSLLYLWRCRRQPRRKPA